jgi:cysteine desulfurase
MPVYLDHQATTPVDPRVFEAMRPWWTDACGNASSTHHEHGRRAAQAVDRAREQVAELTGCDPRGVCFTSGATEANNLVLKGLFDEPGDMRPGLVVSAAEHRAILDPARRLGRRTARLTILPVDPYGAVQPESLMHATSQDEHPVRLVSIIAANNEVGTLNPIHELVQICRKSQTLFHTDATQWIGRLPFDLHALGCDFASLSAHKFGGPQGIGALLVSESARSHPLRPLLEGGGQEGRLRAGTTPVALVVGLGAACEIARHELTTEASRLSQLRDQLWQGLHSALPDLLRNGDSEHVLPNNLNISVPGVDGDVLLNGLTEVSVSSGAACSSTNREPSHVLLAMGVPAPLARASLRFGLGRTTTLADIDFAVEYVVRRVKEIRKRAQES